MLSSSIGLLLRQSLKTFCGKTNIEAFRNNLQQLKTTLDTLTAEQINFDPKLVQEETWQVPGKAPSTYMELYEDENIIICVFTIGPGKKIPLHDHPHMHGLIKVIAGKVKITSYSTNTEKSLQCNDHYRLSNNPILVVEKMEDAIADVNSESSILYPESGNIHEIESIGGAAAFLDILAPPYDANMPVYGPRKCKYYSEVGRINDHVYKLAQVPAPEWFWCDYAPYSGPKLF